MAAKTKNETEGQKIVRLRDVDDLGWADVAAEMGIRQGRCMLMYMQETEGVSNPLTGKNDDDLARKIVAARDKDQQSWGLISARTGFPEGKVRRLYQEASGTPHRGNRIGKGGRHPGDATPPAATKKAPAKKAAATKKAAANGAGKASPSKLAEMDLSQLQERLDGKTLRVERGGKEVRIGVKAITKLAGGEVSFTDKQGKVRSVKVESIVAASK